MKKLLMGIVTVVLTLVLCASAFAMGMDNFIIGGDYETSDEPLALNDPNAVKIADFNEENFVENGELQDQGTAWIEWSASINSMWGCSTAEMNYTNPAQSNIGLLLKVGIFDNNLIKYFGTTFRSEEETMELAKKGLFALENGIIPTQKEFREVGLPFEGMSEDDMNLGLKDVIEILVSKGFMPGMTADEILALTEEDLTSLTEIQRLDLAQLADYSYFESFQSIGESGVINPGYALYQIDLHTLPGLVTLPKGSYKAVYVLNGYDAEKNQLSKFFINIPVTLNVAEDLPEDLQVEHGVTIADKIN